MRAVAGESTLLAAACAALQVDGEAGEIRRRRPQAGWQRLGEAAVLHADRLEDRVRNERVERLPRAVDQRLLNDAVAWNSVSAVTAGPPAWVTP